MYKLKKMAAAVAASALIATGTGFATPVALAQGTATNETAVAPAAIPATGDLTIHKLIGLPATTNSKGQKLENHGGEPAQGIQFKVTRLGTNDTTPIDLTTQDGWAAIAGKQMKGTQLPEGLVKVKNGEVPNVPLTNPQGEVTLEGLKAGIYLVEEPANQRESKGDRAVTGSAPFLVTVPMTNPDGTGWMSSVHVYPKNQAVDKPTKEITEIDGTQPGASLGEDIRYTINAKIPTSADSKGKVQLPSAFTVTDKLPAGLDAAKNFQVTLLAGGTEVPLNESQYTLARSTVNGQHVFRLLINPSAHTTETGNVSLRVVFDAEVKSVNGSMKNTAWVVPEDITDSNASWDPTNPTPGTNPGTSTGDNTPATANYATITIKKTAAGSGEALKDAEFQLFRCGADGNTIKDAKPLVVGKNNTWKTGEDGTVTISGLYLNKKDTNGENYVNPWENMGDSFCLVEKKAPEGYALLAKPHVLTDINDAALASVSENKSVAADIKNASSSGIISRLPLTGGMGIWLILVAGLAMIIVGLAYSRKRV